MDGNAGTNIRITCTDRFQLINTETVWIRRRDDGGLRENTGNGRVGAAHVSGEGQVFVVSVGVHFGWCGR